MEATTGRPPRAGGPVGDEEDGIGGGPSTGARRAGRDPRCPLDPAALQTTPRAPRRPSPVVRALVAVLGFYRRWISPMFPPSCRFHPTCSAYGSTRCAPTGS